MAEDWEGNIFCNINLGWYYKRRTVDLSIPVYVEELMQKHQHNTPRRPEHQPHKHNPTEYGKKIQYAESEDATPPLNKD